MADLSDFKGGQIVIASMVGVSITKTSELFGVARTTVSKVMTSFEKEGKTSLLKQNSGRKRKLSSNDPWTLTRIVRKHQINTAPIITAELDDHLENPVISTKPWFHGRTAIRKPYWNKISLKFQGLSIILSCPCSSAVRYPTGMNQPGFDPSLKYLACLSTLKCYRTKQSVCGWQYKCSPPRQLRILAWNYWLPLTRKCQTLHMK